MKYCDLTEAYHDYKSWCTDHRGYADHVATDGDTPVCEEYAKRHGCNCGHFKPTEDESDVVKALRVLSKALEDADRGMWYTSGNDVAMEALNAVQGAVDSTIRELSKEN